MATRKKPAAEVTAAPAPTSKAPTLAEAIANFKQRTVDKMAEQIDIFNADEVARELAADLNAQKKDVLLRVMGMDSRWGKFEVDHCNGRENPLNKIIMDTCKPMIEEWVQAGIKEFLANKRESMKQAYKTAIIKDVERYINDRQWSHTNEVAKELVSGIVAEAKAEAKAELKRQIEGT
jgi:hypothetical protein